MIHLTNYSSLVTSNQSNSSNCVAMTTTLGASVFAIVNSGACLIAGNQYIVAEGTTQKVIQLVLFSGLGFLGGAITGGTISYYTSKFLTSCFENLSSDKMEATLAHV